MKYARFKSDYYRDGALRSMSADHRWLWFEAVSYAVENNLNGTLPPVEEMALALGRDAWEVEAGFIDLQKAGFMDRRGGWWTIVDMDQYVITNAERQRRYRERKGGGGGKIPYKSVMDSWNQFAASIGLSTIRAVTDARRKGIRARFNEVWPEIEKIYEAIRERPFLRGENDRGWQVTFDYVWCRSDGAVKILEGLGNGGKRKGTHYTYQEALSVWQRELGSSGSFTDHFEVVGKNARGGATFSRKRP